MTENARIMKERIDSAANPNIDTFNVALPSKGRLAFFAQLCPEKKAKKTTSIKPTGLRTRDQKSLKNQKKVAFTVTA